MPVRQSPRAPQPGDERGCGEAFIVWSPREDLVERREQRRGVVLGAGGGSGDAAEDLPENARTFPRTSTRGEALGVLPRSWSREPRMWQSQ